MKPEALAKRADAIRMSRRAIAEAGGINENSVGRAFKRARDTRSSTLNAIEAAIEAEELALLDHLSELHPQFVFKHKAA